MVTTSLWEHPCANSMVQYGNTEFFILVGNPYSSNILTDFDMRKNAIKQYSHNAEVIVMTSFNDLEGDQVRNLTHEQANWFAFKNFGTLHLNFSSKSTKNVHSAVCYLFLMKYFLSNSH